MGYREVYGTICDPLGNGLETEVCFHLQDNLGSYTNTIQYPGRVCQTVTAADGTFSISLWTNEEGMRHSEYVVTFEKAFFKFTLPPGDVPISLSELRSHGATPSPTNPKPTQHDRLTILTSGQTSFALSSIPSEPQNLILYINGVKAVYSVDYTINGSTLSWANPYPLAPTDYLEVYYK